MKYIYCYYALTPSGWKVLEANNSEEEAAERPSDALLVRCEKDADRAFSKPTWTTTWESPDTEALNGALLRNAGHPACP